MNESISIAVVGGGMVGAVQALLLAKALPAAQIVVFDHTAATPDLRPSFDSRSTAIAPTTQQCFEHLGFWPAMQEYATAIEAIAVSDRGHAGMARFDRDDNQGNPLGQVIMNAGMGHVLLNALQQTPTIQTVHADVNRIVPLKNSARLIWQVLTNPQAPAVTEDADLQGDKASHQQGDFSLVVIADGAQSNLRQQIGIKAKTTSYDQLAMVANLRHSEPHQCVAYERFTQNGPLAVLPLGGDKQSQTSTVVLACPEVQANKLKAANEAERIEYVQQQLGYRIGHITAMSEPAFYPLSRVLAEEQVRSHCVLMGNAAHFLHPVAGQGFNLSVRDAMRLTHVLKQAVEQGEPIGALSTLEKYLSQQAQDQRNTVSLSHGFNRIFTGAPLPIQALRSLGMMSLEFSPLIRSTFIELLSGKAQSKPIL